MIAADLAAGGATALAQIEEAIIDAGVARVLPWRTVAAMLDLLPVEDGCRWCSCQLERFGDSPRVTAWICRACHRIDTDWHRQGADDNRSNKAQAEEIRQVARDSWQRVEVRIERTDGLDPLASDGAA